MDMEGCSGRDVYMDAGMRGFIVNFARKNFWRVSSWYDLDDLVQDGWFCYAKCLARYVGRPLLDGRMLPERDPTDEHKRWMMELVKTAFARHVHTLSNRATAQADETTLSQVSGETESPDDAWGRIAPVTHDAFDMTNMPRELQELAETLMSDVRDAYAGFRQYRVGGKVVCETTEERAARLEAAEREQDVCCRRSRVYTDASGRVRIGKRRRRETTNEMYCRLLGLDPREHDVRAIIRDALT